MSDGVQNLLDMYDKADVHDRAEGLMAYPRYQAVMLQFADYYDQPLETVTAAFVALSPNNDYEGNLRSLKSCIVGMLADTPDDDIIVTTFGAAKKRALMYLKQEVDFWETAMGKKTRAFYRNILSPLDAQYATVDGHMFAAWAGEELTMREAAERRFKYKEVEDGIKKVAAIKGLIPCQVQAVIWFARKRTLKIKFDGQRKLFGDSTDLWGTLVDIRELKDFPNEQVPLRGLRPDSGGKDVSIQRCFEW